MGIGPAGAALIGTGAQVAGGFAKGLVSMIEGEPVLNEYGIRKQSTTPTSQTVYGRLAGPSSAPPSRRAPAADPIYDQMDILGARARDDRFREQRMLDEMRRRAYGDISTANQQARMQQEYARNAMMGQAASARGRFNPSLMNAANYAASNVRMQGAAGLVAAQEDERRRAMAAYRDALAAQAMQDKGQLDTERGYQGILRARYDQQEQDKQFLLNLGMSENEANQQLAYRDQVVHVTDD